jgi:hypothetical protein
MEYYSCICFGIQLTHRIVRLQYGDSYCWRQGQCHGIFDFKFPTWNSFPQAPDYTIRAVSNLPSVSTTPAELVAKFAARVFDTGGKFAAGVVDTGGNFASDVVDTGTKIFFATSVVDTGGTP